MTIQPLSKEERPTQTEVFRFPVELIPLSGDLDGRPIPCDHRQGVIRLDTREIISVVGMDYKLVSHSETVDFFESVLKKNGIKAVPIKSRVLQRGCNLYRHYLLPEERDILDYSSKKRGRRKGDIVQLGFDLRNSMDGSTKVSFSVHALRLICTNGLTTPAAIGGSSMVHRGANEVPDKCKEIDDIVHLFDKEILPLWGKFVDIPVDKDTAAKFLQTLRTSDKDRLFMYEKFLGESEQTYWTLYNAVTLRTTHQIADRNYGTAMTIGNQAFRLLSAGCTKGQLIFNPKKNVTFLDEDNEEE